MTDDLGNDVERIEAYNRSVSRFQATMLDASYAADRATGAFKRFGGVADPSGLPRASKGWRRHVRRQKGQQRKQITATWRKIQ